MKQKQIIGLILCLFILLLAACGSAPEAAEPTATSESQAQTVGTGSAPAAPDKEATEPAPEPTAEPTAAAVQDSEPTTEPTAEPTTEAPAADMMALTADTDPLQAIARSRLANLDATSIRTTTTVTNQDTGEVANTIIGETLLPDRMRVITDFSEMVIVDGVTYNKINGEWSVMDIDMSGLLGEVADPEAAADPQGSLLQLIEQLGLTISNVQLEGPETLDGREMLVYSYTETLGELAAQNRVWLGAEDGRLYRTESVSELNGENLLTLAVYEYDVPLTIEAPQINEGG